MELVRVVRENWLLSGVAFCVGWPALLVFSPVYVPPLLCYIAYSTYTSSKGNHSIQPNPAQHQQAGSLSALEDAPSKPRPLTLEVHAEREDSATSQNEEQSPTPESQSTEQPTPQVVSNQMTSAHTGNEEKGQLKTPVSKASQDAKEAASKQSSESVVKSPETGAAQKESAKQDDGLKPAEAAHQRSVQQEDNKKPMEAAEKPAVEQSGSKKQVVEAMASVKGDGKKLNEEAAKKEDVKGDNSKEATKKGHDGQEQVKEVAKEKDGQQEDSKKVVEVVAEMPVVKVGQTQPSSAPIFTTMTQSAAQAGETPAKSKSDQKPTGTPTTSKKAEAAPKSAPLSPKKKAHPPETTKATAKVTDEAAHHAPRLVLSSEQMQPPVLSAPHEPAVGEKKPAGPTESRPSKQARTDSSTAATSATDVPSQAEGKGPSNHEAEGHKSEHMKSKLKKTKKKLGQVVSAVQHALHHD